MMKQMEKLKGYSGTQSSILSNLSKTWFRFIDCREAAIGLHSTKRDLKK